MSGEICWVQENDSVAVVEVAPLGACAFSKSLGCQYDAKASHAHVLLRRRSLWQTPREQFEIAISSLTLSLAVVSWQVF